MTKIFQLFLPFSMFFLHSPSPSIAATSASWQIKINHQYSTTEVNSRGGETKFKDFIKSEIKRKTNGKNINSSVDSSVKNGRKTFTTTVSSNSSLEDLKQVLFSDLKSEVNLTNVPTELALTHQAAKGQSVQMFIEDNPSTGYSWQFNDTSGHYSVEKPTHYEVKNIMPAGMVGYPQRQVVYLKSNSNSTSTIKLNYKRNWEKEDTVQQIGITLNQISNTVDLVNPTSPSVKGVSTETESLSVLKNAFSKIVSFFSNLKITPVKGASSLPSSFDWRSSNVVPPVRNQGNCGSCWAFASQGVFESSMALRLGAAPVDTSEQFLVSCNNNGWSCNGGWIALGYDTNTLGKSQTEIGAVAESSFPYTATTASCPSNLSHPYKAATYSSISSSTPGSIDSIKQAIYSHGPVFTAVCVGPAFSTYTGGVFAADEKASCSGGINHAVMIVGWDDSTQSWIVRNSWGPSWGESGYIRMGYGVSNVGSYVTYADYTTAPISNPTTVPTAIPTVNPTSAPNIPTTIPTVKPTSVPSVPTAIPTIKPTAVPTYAYPTQVPQPTQWRHNNRNFNH